MALAARCLTAILVVVTFSPVSAAWSHKRPRPRLESSVWNPAGDSPSNPAMRLSMAVASTTVIYSSTFDAGASCDQAGWTRVDLTAQVGDFFHVDDYAGLNPSAFAPLAGAHSLWCGARPQASGPLCGYMTLPGYGNSWDQTFVTKACIPVSPDGILDVSFLARFDSEPSYDYTTLEYTTDCSGATGWTVIAGGQHAPSGWTGKLPATNWIAGAMYGGSYNIGTSGPVRVRLHFRSDSGWSDQDGLTDTNGALHVDNLKAEGLATEDFEDEAVGATTSDDWENVPTPGYGIYAGLVSGLSALQEDPCVRDLSCIWAFFVGSTVNYSCGGHPEQLAVPFGNADNQYLWNEIWSPSIALPSPGSPVDLAFSVYRDLPLDNLIFYYLRVRDVSGPCPGPWKGNQLYFGDQKDWFRFRVSLGKYLDLSTATHIQIALGCLDLCGEKCGVYGSGQCHSQSPLFDNVTVTQIGTHGPEWAIDDVDQFQDNFSADGTITGTVRADMAKDILGYLSSGSIIPGDSSVVRVSDPVGLATDPTFGRAAVYCYVAVWPRGQANKSGGALTQDPTRWPVVGSWTDAGGTSWTCLRADTVFDRGVRQLGQFCVDLNDNLFTPGDTVCFFYAAKNTDGQETVAFGSSLGLVGADREEAATNPAEFTCLPAGGHNRGGDILYVDGMDGRGAQPYWDRAFQSIGLLDKVDRFDVRGPSSAVSNRLASRVKSISQLLGAYKVILWDGGDLEVNLGDGTGTPEKSNDYKLLNDFLNQLPDPGGVYLSGDDVAERLAGYTGTSAVTFRTTYLPFNLIAPDARPTYGLSPTGVPRAGGCYSDDFTIFGGCPLINDFDVMEPTGTTTMEVGYGMPGTTNGAVIANQVVNGNGVPVGAVLSGFSFIYLYDNDTDGISDRAKFLHDTLVWLTDAPNLPVSTPGLVTNSLSQNVPNPFNPTTTIAYSVKSRTHVRLLVYDVSGARVRTLADGDVAAGAHVVKWDGRNDAGRSVASGVYFYRLVAKGFSRTRKMVMLK